MRFCLAFILFFALNASAAFACPFSKPRDLHGFLRASIVVEAMVSRLERVTSPWRSHGQVSALHLRISQSLKGRAPKSVVLLMNHYGDLERLQKKFDRRTWIIVAIEPIPKAHYRYAKDQNYFVVTGSPCGGVGPYLSGTTQARAVEMIFDGEGDPVAEADLFNKLLRYGPRQK